MSMVRYKCRISELKVIDINWRAIGLSAKITCNSPFAYAYPETYSYITTTSKTINLLSRHSNIGYYYPNIKIALPSGVTSISIKNITDNNKEFKLTGFANASGKTITIDNKNQIITDSTGTNMYQFFNFNFFRLLHGDNSILINGASTIEFMCEFPINTGG